MLLKNNVLILNNFNYYIELSRRDDIISLIYLLIYLYEGTLPWISLKGVNLFNVVGKMKISLSPSAIFSRYN